MACLRDCIVTLVEFVRLFSIVYYQLDGKEDTLTRYIEVRFPFMETRSATQWKS